jgi:hypothetical protein
MGCMTKRCKNCVAGLFGACGDDYCRTERQGLIEDARWTAEGRGHALEGFVKQKHVPVWTARCGRCGRSVTVRLDPAPGEPDLEGEALEVECVGG